MSAKTPRVFHLHRAPLGTRKPSRELIEEAFSLVRRLHLPRKHSDLITPQAIQTRATSLFSLTFTTWNRFN
jgi:hypothetical protein